MARTKQQQPESNPSLSIKAVTKSSVWDIQENDVFRMWEAASKDAEVKENVNHYLDIFKSAFLIEEIKEDVTMVKKSYEKRGYKVAQIKFDENMRFAWAIKKRPIMRVTDLTYENIRHISAAKLIEVLERNFGGGWESLSQSIQDIIESGFDISTTTLPKDRLHKPGGLYEKKVNDGFEVLEIPKGLWVEAIFAKEKPEAIAAPVFLADEESEKNGEDREDSDNNEGEEEDIDDDNFKQDDDDDDTFDDEKLTEESYRTTYETSPDELNLEAEDISEDEDY